MTFISTVKRWLGRTDWYRLQSFSRFITKRFIDDELFASAGALAYTTMFAIVPLSADDMQLARALGKRVAETARKLSA